MLSSVETRALIYKSKGNIVFPLIPTIIPQLQLFVNDSLQNMSKVIVAFPEGMNANKKVN